MKRIYKVAGIVAVFILVMLLSLGLSRGMPITLVVEVDGAGVIDRTVEVQNERGWTEQTYHSDMRTPSLGYWGTSQIDIYETIELREGNETHIKVSGKYNLDYIYRLTDIKNYAVGSRYKISHTGTEEGSNTFYVSNNMSYMTVAKKVSGNGRWCILRKNATGGIYRDKGDYRGNFTIRFEDKRIMGVRKAHDTVGDWLACP